MKRNKKIINLTFLSLLLIFVPFIFSACSKVRAMTITNQDNTIDEIVAITITPEDVMNAGYNITEVKQDIKDKSKQLAQLMINKLNEKILFDLMLVEDNESKEVLLSYKDGITIIENDWKENSYKIGIKFKNIDIYKYYYNIKENVKTETYKEKHFLYTKVYYYASTMFVKHYELYESVNNYYSIKYAQLIHNENNLLLYTYKTDLRRQHSDANYINKINGEYYHTWVVDKNNIEKPIMLYYNIANPQNWIIVSVLITVSVTIIVGGIALLISLNNKKKEQ